VTKILIATRNAHKVGEIQAILGPQFSCRAVSEYPAAPAVIEDQNDFAGNALKKAVELAGWLTRTGPTGGGLVLDYVLADDSGLMVDALDGAPGVHSARFAALDSGSPDNSTDAENNAKLLRLLQAVPLEKRAARFCCVLALVSLADKSKPSVDLFPGTCEGRIQFNPSGGGGFGYDPLFVPTGFDRTFAELGETEKNRISHRAQALARLKAKLCP